jgi:hypothetical protein
MALVKHVAAAAGREYMAGLLSKRQERSMENVKYGETAYRGDNRCQ